jgi:hypothetical protein
MNGASPRQLMARYAIGTGFIGDHYWTMTGVEHAGNMIDLFRNVSIAGGLLVSRPPAAIEDTRFPVGPTGSVDVRTARLAGKIRRFAKRAMRKRVPISRRCPRHRGECIASAPRGDIRPHQLFSPSPFAALYSENLFGCVEQAEHLGGVERRLDEGRFAVRADN